MLSFRWSRWGRRSRRRVASSIRLLRFLAKSPRFRKGSAIGTRIAAFPASTRRYSKRWWVQDSGFTEEQKQYLEAFIAALIKKRGAGMPTPSASVQADAQAGGSATDEKRLRDPASIHLEA